MDTRRSLVDVAYEVLAERYDDYTSRGAENEPMPFNELLLEVGRRLGIDDESTLIKIASKFYTGLTIDGRFVIKENNTWVLREHERYETLHIDMNAAYSVDEFENEEGDASETERELGEEEEEEGDEEDFQSSDYDDEEDDN